MGAPRFVIGVAAAGLALATGAAPAAVGAQGWGVEGGTAANAWRSPAVSAQAPALVPGWPGPDAATPLVAPDGTLEVGVSPVRAGPSTAVLNPDGTWRALLPVPGLAAIGPDGRRYGVGASRVAAYTPAGTPLWSVPKPGWEASDTRVLPAPGGDVYVAGERALLALDGSGRTRWTQDWSQQPGPVAVGPDGTAYYGASTWSGQPPVEASALAARTPDGRILWSRPVAGGVRRIAVADDGSLRVLSGGRRPVLASLAPDGAERWSLPVASGAMSLGADGTAYLPVGAGARRAGRIVTPGALWAVGPGGAVRWTHRARLVGSNPVVGGDGTVYVGGSPLVAVRPDGSRAWSFPATSGPVVPMAIGVDGTLYARAEGAGGTYALPAMDLALAGPSAPRRVSVPRLRTQRGLLARVSLSSTRVRLRGPVSLCPAPGGPCRPAHPLGAVLRYSLTRDSTVVFVVRRARDGRIMSRVVRHARPGISWRSLADAAGWRSLPAGRYALTLCATAGRARATARPLPFTVLPPGA